MRKKKILFLCTGNSCRSQMAEGLMRHMASDRFEVFSAGTEPSGINEAAVRIMLEVGIDISSQTSDSVDRYSEEKFDYVVTVCDNARQACPVFPGGTHYLHWDIDDPADFAGTCEEHDMFLSVREEITSKIKHFLGTGKNKNLD